MRESDILQAVRLRASQLGAIVWRNNCGAYKTAHGHYIKYGVANPGGSDLLGLTQITVTQEMVGKLVAVFTALEIKQPNKKPTPEQQAFIDCINKNGGIAAVISDPEQLNNILK